MVTRIRSKIDPIDNELVALRRRLAVAIFAAVTVYSLGTAGYFLLGRGRWTIGECAYMTIISVTTVGFGEVLDGLGDVSYGRFFTGFLILSGTAIALYSVSVLTTFLIEGEFLHIRRRKKMRDRMARMAGHIIICGAGRTGTHIAKELAVAGRSFVLVDREKAEIDRCVDSLEQSSVDFVVGDATDDAVLIAAGVERAYGVMAALPDDRDNLYVVVTARGFDPNIRIVAKAVDPRAVPKLRSAGADRVVSVNRLGGHRMASEMVRPHVVEFIETMIRDKDKNLRFEEVIIPESSPLVGQPLGSADIRRVGECLVVAAGQRGNYTYTPGPDFYLAAGMTLIVLGESRSVQRLCESGLFCAGEDSKPA